MTDGIDAERGVQDEKRPEDAGQQKAAEPTQHSSGQQPDREWQSQSRQDDQGIPAVLPHDHAILPKPGRVSFGAVGILQEEPAAVAVPEPLCRIVGILFLVHARVVPCVIGPPLQH